MYYNVCPDCGAHLDPGEPCDCKAVKKQNEEKYNRMLSVDEANQIRMNLEGTYDQTIA